jgi:DNA-binding XRE family transcriptional regulator
VAQREHLLETLLAMQPELPNKTLEEVKTDIAVNLKNIRKSQNIAQEKLALEAGVDRTFVSKIERGIGNPSLEILLRLANRLGVSVADLLATS